MDDIRNAIKDWMLVMRAAEMATAVSHVTEPQLRLMARDTLEKVRVQYASLPVRSFLDSTEEISDDEIARHFEARKNTPAGEGEGLGHGYQTPTQLVVQYVMADVSKLTADMTVTEEEARTYHTEYKGLFRRPTPRRPRISLPTPPPPATPAPAPDAATTPKPEAAVPPVTPQPTTPPAATPAPQPPTPAPDAATTPKPQAAAPPQPKVPTTVKAAIVYAQDVEPRPATTASTPATRHASTQPAAAAATAATTKAATTAAATTTAAAATTVATPTPTAAPTTPPTTPASPYQTFEEARADVEVRIKKDRATKKATEFMQTLVLNLTEPWDGAERDEAGYKKPPSEAVTQEDFFEKALATKARLVGWRRLVAACEVVMTAPFDATSQGAVRVPRLGFALSAAGGTDSFSNLVLKVNGVAAFPKEDSGENTSLYRAVHQPSPIVLKEGATGNVFVFRVFRVTPAQAPKLADVRSKVETDLRELHAFYRAEQAAHALAEQARSDGLKKAFDDLAALDEAGRRHARRADAVSFARITRRWDLFSSGGFTEQPAFTIGGTPEETKQFIDACFAAGKITTTQPTDHKVRVVAQPARKQYMVIQWEGIEPMRRDDYDRERQQLSSQLGMLRQLHAQTEWFKPENIRRRARFKKEAS